MAVVVFQDDDRAYLDWRERHEATGPDHRSGSRATRERPSWGNW